MTLAYGESLGRMMLSRDNLQGVVQRNDLCPRRGLQTSGGTNGKGTKVAFRDTVPSQTIPQYKAKTKCKDGEDMRTCPTEVKKGAFVRHDDDFGLRDRSDPFGSNETPNIPTQHSLVLAAGNGCSNAIAAILEADDDEELLEKVKKDRKKRLERQGVISSSGQEKGYLQDVVYKLSEIGQAIDNNDLSTASSVLGGSTDTEWVKNANVAFNKLSSSPEEKTQVETFNSSLASLISSVTKNDVESSKVAFVTSATAFEKWTTLTGLVGQLKGL
ncbi:hypothetical protein GOBAR_AA31662 [Gossypium barbadense]|uniref:Maintenance of Photosystem II under High light 2 C-terminal domain-containing protein n=1 Tax=Gossypium barbadense TaxID=3634 RepID=A0A2P5WD72_GOSBA|nr:hypothetical protein GOBAR_AA31662 [Gossypium barbadense]